MNARRQIRGPQSWPKWNSTQLIIGPQNRPKWNVRRLTRGRELAKMNARQRIRGPRNWPKWYARRLIIGPRNWPKLNARQLIIGPQNWPKWNNWLEAENWPKINKMPTELAKNETRCRRNRPKLKRRLASQARMLAHKFIKGDWQFNARMLAQKIKDICRRNWLKFNRGYWRVVQPKGIPDLHQPTELSHSECTRH